LNPEIISKESDTNTDNPPPKTSERIQAEQVTQCLCTGIKQISALTFGTLLSSQESDAHRASDFRLKLRGNSPNFTVSSGAGQIGLFRPSPPARLSDRNPPRRVSASKTFREFVGAAGRFRVLRLAPTRRTLLTFAVQMQIGVPDPVRAPCKPPSAPVIRHQDEAVVVPLVTSLTRVSAGDNLHDAVPHKQFSRAIHSPRTPSSYSRPRHIRRTRNRQGGSRSADSHLSCTAPPSRRLSASGRS